MKYIDTEHAVQEQYSISDLYIDNYKSYNELWRNHWKFYVFKLFGGSLMS